MLLQLLPKLVSRLDTVSVLIRDTVRTVTVNPSPGPSWWDRLWPVLLGGLLAAAGGLLAQWGRLALEDRRGKNDLKERIKYDVAQVDLMEKNFATSAATGVPPIVGRDLTTLAERFEADRRFVGRLATEAYRTNVVDWYARMRIVGAHIEVIENDYVPQLKKEGRDVGVPRTLAVTQLKDLAEQGRGLLKDLATEGRTKWSTRRRTREAPPARSL